MSVMLQFQRVGDAKFDIYDKEFFCVKKALKLQMLSKYENQTAHLCIKNNYPFLDLRCINRLRKFRHFVLSNVL